MNGHPDDFQTPAIALNPLLPYLRKDWVIWECAWGEGLLAQHLKQRNFRVVGDKDIDFLNERDTPLNWDCAVTNPPYSLKEEFLERVYKLEKPFAFLMPLTSLEGKKRGELYRKFGIQLIIPNKRINFIKSDSKGSGSWFQTAWFCHKLNLPKDLNFVKLEKIDF